MCDIEYNVMHLIIRRYDSFPYQLQFNVLDNKTKHKLNQSNRVYLSVLMHWFLFLLLLLSCTMCMI